MLIITYLKYINPHNLEKIASLGRHGSTSKPHYKVIYCPLLLILSIIEVKKPSHIMFFCVVLKTLILNIHQPTFRCTVNSLI